MSPHRLPLVATCLLLASSACGTSRTGQVMGPLDTTTTPPPPAPQTFDLRFKGVGILSSNTDLVHENILATTGSALWITRDSVAGTPLELGTELCSATTCAWFFDWFALPASVVRVGAAYKASILANLPLFLDTASTDTVITSLDLEPAVGVFAVSETATSQAGGYHLVPAVVPLNGLQAAASAEAAQHRVITAVSFDSGQVHYLSYAWDHDSSPGYDAQIAQTDIPNAGTAAMSLAASGYIVTAVGGDSTDGFVLVGTRVHGNAAARSLLVNPGPSVDLSGYAVVAYLVEPTGSVTFIVEK